MESGRAVAMVITSLLVKSLADPRRQFLVYKKYLSLNRHRCKPRSLFPFWWCFLCSTMLPPPSLRLLLLIHSDSPDNMQSSSIKKFVRSYRSIVSLKQFQILHNTDCLGPVELSRSRPANHFHRYRISPAGKGPQHRSHLPIHYT